MDTPLGKLKVWSKHDVDSPSDYPGVYIDLVRANGEEELLACVEYESTNSCLQTCVYGDALSDYPTDIVEHINVNGSREIGVL